MKNYRFSNWLYTLCQQIIITYHRRRKINHPLPEDLSMSAAGPAAEAEADSLKERLWQAAASLPQKQFHVIWLRYVEEMRWRK